MDFLKEIIHNILFFEKRAVLFFSAIQEAQNYQNKC